MADTDWTHNPGDPSQTDEEATGTGFEETADEALDEKLEFEGADLSAPSAEEDAETEAAEEAELATLDAEVDAAAADAAADIADEDAAAGEIDELTQAHAQVEELTNDLKRINAEYTNYRRRVERDRLSIIEGAKADVAAKLLPILDDLDLAATHGDLTGPLKAASDKLQGVMGAIKAEPFGAEGEEFNPELHEAVQDQSTGEEKVLGTVLRKGYRLGERVLRTALVIIDDPAS